MSISVAFFGSMAVLAIGTVVVHFCKDMFGNRPMATRNKR